MLELPEVLTTASQLKDSTAGRTVSEVLPPTKVHRFCWYNGEPAAYNTVLKGKKIISSEGFGIFVEIIFEEGYRLCFNDSVNARLIPLEKVPKNYQLLIVLDDGMALVFTVAMYGGMIVHRGDYADEYYEKSRNAVSPFSDEFKIYFYDRIKRCKPVSSVKALLATDQHFPGIGNGVLQDILFEAGIHPKRKLQALGEEEKQRLLSCMVSVLTAMAEQGGRDTEKDLFGNPGGYRTKMSKNTWKEPCPVCGGTINKETYMGGSVYYCPVCQPPD